jgi:hypothetical protein
LRTPLRGPNSKAERVHSLVLEKLECLLGGSHSAEHAPPPLREALRELRPHVEAELEALETLEWLRDLTGEEHARQRAFTVFLSVVGPSEVDHQEGDESTRARLLAALRYGAATNIELQELTGAEVGTVRNNLSELINFDSFSISGTGPLLGVPPRRPKLFRQRTFRRSTDNALST